jgi:predicted SAM-dependent methyltransferase
MENRPKGETDNCRDRLAKYCEGQGLDIGCGVTKIKPEAIGIDLYHPNADMKEDARDLGFYPEGHFDYVYSSHLLEELQNTEETLKGWLRIIKLGGKIVLYQADRDFYHPLGSPECNPTHKHHFIWEDLWAIFKKITGVKLVHYKRYGSKTIPGSEWSFELVVQKIEAGKIEENSRVAVDLSNIKYSLNMLFWDCKDPDRYNNVHFTWPQLQKFTTYLKNKGINASCNLYDFSETKTIKIPEAIHIPTPAGEFKKAWKINRVIEANEDSTFFSLFDSDAFFSEEDYPRVHNLLKDFQPNDFFVFNLYDLMSIIGIDFAGATYDPNKFQLAFRHLGALGGAYIVYTQALVDIGGFDERFICWGGEDEDVSNRLELNGLKKHLVEIPLYHLPHARMSLQQIKTPQYAAQCHVLYNDKIIKRNFLKGLKNV